MGKEETGRCSDIELRVLKYFLVTAREENITRAAAILHITQPTLSRQLMQMEEELGVKLFHRGRHNILLTEEGMLLRRRAQEIIDLTEKTEKELLHGGGTVAGEISIGCGETQNVKLLCKMIASFRECYPDVKFNIYTAIADDVKEKLENGVLDMGLLLEPVEISRYHYMKMPFREKYYVLMRKDSPLAGKESVTPKDLADVPLIIPKRQSVYNQVENWFGSNVDRLNVVSTCNLSKNNLSAMVESGIGAAVMIKVLPEYEGLLFCPMEPEIVIGCVLVWKKNRAISSAMERFIAYIKEYLAGLEQNNIRE